MLSVQTKDNPQFLINFLLCLSNKGYSLLHVICLHKKGKTNQSNKLTKTGKPANISIRCLRLLCLNPLFDLFQIINWLRGSATASKDGGMRILSHESQSFGKGIGKSIAEWSRILRQAVGEEVLDLMFTENRFNGVTRIYRKYILSDKGNNFLKSPIDVFVKGPYDEAATGKTGTERRKQQMPREAVHAFVKISPDKKHALIF